MKLLDIMPDEVRTKLIRKCYAPRETILPAEQDNNYLYFLLDGKAEAYLLNEQGSIANIHLYEAGSLFGELEQFWNGRKPVEITALTPCTTLRLHRNDLYAWMQRDFEVTKLIICIMAEKLIANSEYIEAVSLMTVRERLLRCIAAHLTLGDLNMLTKEQVVKETGAPLRSINRSIAECVGKGILRYERKRFKILDDAIILKYQP